MWNGSSHAPHTTQEHLQPGPAIEMPETAIHISPARSPDITAAPGVLQALRGATDMLCRTFVTETDLTVQSVPPVKFATTDVLPAVEVADNEQRMSVSSPDLYEDRKDRKVPAGLDCGWGEHTARAEPDDAGDTEERAVVENTHCILAYPMYQTRTRRPVMELGYDSGPVSVMVSDSSGSTDEIDVQYRRPKAKHRSRPRHRKYRKPSSNRERGYTSSPQEYGALNEAVDSLMEQLEQPELLGPEPGYTPPVDGRHPLTPLARPARVSQEDMQRVRTVCNLLESITETIRDEGRSGKADPVVMDLRDHSYSRDGGARHTRRSPVRKKWIATIPAYCRTPSVPSAEAERPRSRIIKEWVAPKGPDIRQASATRSSELDVSTSPDGAVLTVRKSETASPGRKKGNVRKQEATLMWSTKDQTKPNYYAVESAEHEGQNMNRKDEGTERHEDGNVKKAGAQNTDAEARPKKKAVATKNATNSSPQGAHTGRKVEGDERQQMKGEDEEKDETEEEKGKQDSQKTERMSPQKRKRYKVGSELKKPRKEDTTVHVVVSTSTLIKNEVCSRDELEDYTNIRRAILNPRGGLSPDIHREDELDRRQTGRHQVQRPNEGSSRPAAPNERRIRDISPERRSVEREAKEAAPTQAYRRPNSDLRDRRSSREYRRNDDGNIRRKHLPGYITATEGGPSEGLSVSVQSRDADTGYGVPASAHSGEYVQGDFSGGPSTDYRKETESDYRSREPSLEHRRSLDSDFGRGRPNRDHRRAFKETQSPLEYRRSAEAEYHGGEPSSFDYNRATGSDSKLNGLAQDYCHTDSDRCRGKETPRDSFGGLAAELARSAPFGQWNEGDPRDQWVDADSTSSRRACSSDQWAGTRGARNTQLSHQQWAGTVDSFRQPTSDHAITYDRWRASGVGDRVITQERWKGQHRELRRRRSSRRQWAGVSPNDQWTDARRTQGSQPSREQWVSVDSASTGQVPSSDLRTGAEGQQSRQTSPEQCTGAADPLRQPTSDHGIAYERWRSSSLGDTNTAREESTGQERQFRRRSSSRGERVTAVDVTLGRRVSYPDQWDGAQRPRSEQPFPDLRVGADGALSARVPSRDQWIGTEEPRSMQPPTDQWAGDDVASRRRVPSRDRRTGPQSIQPLPEQWVGVDNAFRGRLPSRGQWAGPETPRSIEPPPQPRTGGDDAFRQQTSDHVINYRKGREVSLGCTGTTQQQWTSQSWQRVGGVEGTPGGRVPSRDQWTEGHKSRSRQPYPEQQMGVDGTVSGMSPACDQWTEAERPQSRLPPSDQWAGIHDALGGRVPSCGQRTGGEGARGKEPSPEQFTGTFDPLRQRASDNAIIYERWRASTLDGRGITQEQWRGQDGQLRRPNSSRDRWAGGVENTLEGRVPSINRWVGAEGPRSGHLYREQWTGADAASRGRVPSRDQWSAAEGHRSRQPSPKQRAGVDVALRGRVHSRDQWTNTEGTQSRQMSPEQWVGVEAALKVRVPSRDKWTNTERPRSGRSPPEQNAGVEAASRGRVPSRDQWTSTEGPRSTQPSPEQRPGVDAASRERTPLRDEWPNTKELRIKQPSPSQRASVDVTIRGRVPSRDQWTSTEELRRRQPSPKQRSGVDAALRGRVPSRDCGTGDERPGNWPPPLDQLTAAVEQFRKQPPGASPREEWSDSAIGDDRQKRSGQAGELRSRSSSRDRRLSVDAAFRRRASSGEQRAPAQWPRSKQPPDDQMIGAADLRRTPPSDQTLLQGLLAEDVPGSKRVTLGRWRGQDAEIRSRGSCREQRAVVDAALTGRISSRNQWIVSERPHSRQPSRVQWKDAADTFRRQASGEMWTDAVDDTRRREPSPRQWMDFEYIRSEAKPFQDKISGVEYQLQAREPSQELWVTTGEIRGQGVRRDHKRGAERFKKRQPSGEWMVTADDTRRMDSRSDSSNLLPSAAYSKRTTDTTSYPGRQQAYASGSVQRIRPGDDVPRKVYRIASDSSITPQVDRQVSSYVGINSCRVHRSANSEALDRNVSKEMVSGVEIERQGPHRTDSVEEVKPEMDISMQIARRAEKRLMDSSKQRDTTLLAHREEEGGSKTHEITLCLYPEEEKPATVIIEKSRSNKKTKAARRKEPKESRTTKESEQTIELMQDTEIEGTNSPADACRKSKQKTASPKTKKAVESPASSVGDGGKPKLDKKRPSNERQPGQRINVWHIPKEDLDRHLEALAAERSETRQSLTSRCSSSKDSCSPTGLASTLSSSRQSGSTQVWSKRSHSRRRGSKRRGRKRSRSRRDESRESRQRGGRKTRDGEARPYEVIHGPVLETGGVGFEVEEFRSKRMRRREREPSQSLSLELIIEPKFPACVSSDKAGKTPRSTTPVTASPRTSPFPCGQRSPLVGQTAAAHSMQEPSGIYGVQQAIIIPGPGRQPVLVHEVARPRPIPRSSPVHVIHPAVPTYVLQTTGGQTIATQIPGQPAVLPQGTRNLQASLVPQMTPPANRHFPFPQGRASPLRNLSPGPVPRTIIIQPSLPGEPQMQKYPQEEPKQEQRLILQRDIQYTIPPRPMPPAFVTPIFSAQTTVTPRSLLSKQREQQQNSCPRSTWQCRKSTGAQGETRGALSNATMMRSPRSAFSQPVFATCLETSSVACMEPASEHTQTLTSTSAPVLDGTAHVTAFPSYPYSSGSDEDEARSSPASPWDKYPMDEWDRCNPMSTDPMIPKQDRPTRNVPKSFRGFSNKRQSIIYFVLLVAAVASLAGAVSLYSKRKWPFGDESFEGGETAKMFAPLENVLDAGSLPRNVTKPCTGCSSEAPTVSRSQPHPSPKPGGRRLAGVTTNQPGPVSVTRT